MNAQSIPRAPWSLDLRTALVWGVLAGLSAIALMPYLMQLMPQTFEKLRVPVPAFVALQALQTTVLIGLLSLAGLRMGRRVGLGSPLMQAWLGRTRPPDAKTLRPAQAIGLGMVAGIVPQREPQPALRPPRAGSTLCRRIHR